VYPIPPKPIVTVNGDTLHSNALYGNQWYFQGAILPGDTNQNLVAPYTGWYYDIVTLHGCSSLQSDSVYVIVIGIILQNNEATVAIYPNPNDGRFTLAITSPEAKFDIMIFNTIGVMVHNVTNIHVNGVEKRILDISELPSGVYTVIIKSEKSSVMKKIIIDK
jgi:hypothetical protein